MRIEPLVPDLPGYRDATLISTGSTSLVFRAVQTRLARTVAIKVLLVDGNAATHAQYQRELETTVLLSSQPHIVGIIDTGTTDAGNPYIVMEYCPGGSYGQILKQRGPLPVDEVIDVGMKIAEALQAAHDVGVLHRDVKPSNILRSAFGPALADFGIARAPHQLAGTTSLDQMTPHHASPEAMRKDNQSPASDLYSLASTLWHLLAGRPPFADPARGPQDLDSLRQQVLHEPAPRVPRADVPEWLQRELLRALAKDPRQRHPSAYTFAEVLRYQAYRAMPDTATGSPAAAPQSPAAPYLPGAPSLPADPNLPAASQLPTAQAPVSGPPQPPPAGQPPLVAQPPAAPQSAPPQVSGPPAPQMPPVAGWPDSPTTAPREAFRWPSAAPTRRTDPLLEPQAPALDPAAKEAAAASTIIWRDQPAGQPGHDVPGAGEPADESASVPGVSEAGPSVSGPGSTNEPGSPTASDEQDPAAGVAPEPAGDAPAARESSIGAALTHPTEVRPAVNPVSSPGGTGAVPHQVQPPVSSPPGTPYPTGPVSAPPGTPPYPGRPAPPYGSAAQPTARPMSVPPVSGAPVSSPPASSSPRSGPPMSGPPMSGPPMSGPPMSGPPMSGPPMSGPPMSGPPMSGRPASGPPMAGRQMSSPPLTGPPMSGPPLTFGGPAGAAGPSPNAGWPGEPSPRKRRGPLIAVAAGSAVVLIAVIGVVASLRGGSSPQSGPSADPSASHTLGVTNQGAPTDVKLDDKGTSVTVTWSDPSGGTVTFAVLGAPEGTQPHLLGAPKPGMTSYTQEGVNSAVDYCYIVTAVYGASAVAYSPEVCTHRTG